MIRSQKIKRLGAVFSFVTLWLLVSGAVFTVLLTTGILPQYVKDFVSDAVAAFDDTAQDQTAVTPKDMAALEIPKIGITAPIIYPTSTDLTILKRAAMQGVVHYPGSAMPGEKGNVYIFGHSSSKLFNRNPNSAAFTELSKITKGDALIIHTLSGKYLYLVTSVQILKPDETKIYLESSDAKLTLSTCWPVGDPSNRLIVEAELAGRSLIN